MTNPIGTGTATKSFNGPRDFMAEVYRHAIGQTGSLSEYLRTAVVEKVEREDPATARRMRAELRQYYGSMILGLLSVFHFTIATTNAGGAGESQLDDLRRAPRAHRLRVPSRKDF